LKDQINNDFVFEGKEHVGVLYYLRFPFIGVYWIIIELVFNVRSYYELTPIDFVLAIVLFLILSIFIIYLIYSSTIKIEINNNYLKIYNNDKLSIDIPLVNIRKIIVGEAFFMFGFHFIPFLREVIQINYVKNNKIKTLNLPTRTLKQKSQFDRLYQILYHYSLNNYNKLINK
jgi:hypothetical protein